MQLSHSRPVGAVRFDEPNLVSSSGLVPVMALADKVGMADLAQKWLSVPTDKGANAGGKVAALVAGMVAGADCIDDMAILRHGAMRKLFTGCYAPSTLGSFLRAFTFGHVRQLDAVASRTLVGLAETTPIVSGIGGPAIIDIDDSIIEVHGYAKQGAGFGYSGVRGLNWILATVTTEAAAPVIVAQRLRKGSVGSPRGATRLVRDAIKTVKTIRSKTATGKVLIRADSAFYGHPTIGAATAAGADVSVTVRQSPTIKKAIASIGADAWTAIEYPNAIFDADTGTWVSKAEVAEIPFTAFESQARKNRIPGRLVVRRIPDVNAEAHHAAGQDGLFDMWRFHAFFTTQWSAEIDTVAADKQHRAHAVIEQVHADLKNSAAAHMPSGVFTANAAWLVCAVIAFNLTRAAATLTRQRSLARATTATIRRTLIAVPARIAASARKLTLHLPAAWPWQTAWETMHSAISGVSPPTPVTT